MKKVLNVGGNNKGIALPDHFSEFEHILLDIDPKGSPDIICDARELITHDPEQYDAIYCSHNLEHYFRHDVRKVLAGFQHVLKDNGFAQIRVPDIGRLIRLTARRNMDIDDVVYQSPAGPVRVLDMLYGFQPQIEKSGEDYYAHKTGFTQQSMRNTLQSAGFSTFLRLPGKLEINIVAFKQAPDEYTRSLFNLSPANTEWEGS